MAIKMHEPIGKAPNGPLIARLLLGGYFVMAGLSKFKVMAAFVAQMKTFGVLPDNVASLYGVLLPYLEVFVGGSLILGLWTTLAGLMGGFLLVTYVLAFGLFPGGHDIFNKDLVLLGGALSLLYTGPGAYSLDNLRRPPAA